MKRWVQNDRLGFTIPYRQRGLLARYIPDFIVVTDRDENVIVEIKGQFTDDADTKAKAADDGWKRSIVSAGTESGGTFSLKIRGDLGSS